MPGCARLAHADMCSPAEGAGWERVGKAGSHIARDRCGSCFTCGSWMAAIPRGAAVWGHASVNALWRATTLSHSVPLRAKSRSVCVCADKSSGGIFVLEYFRSVEYSAFQAVATHFCSLWT